jgi:Lsr2 protein
VTTQNGGYSRQRLQKQMTECDGPAGSTSEPARGRRAPAGGASWISPLMCGVAAAARDARLGRLQAPSQWGATMAQKVTVALEDDLDGGPAAETVRCAVDGAAYEIDLSTKNAAAFRKQLAPYREHARKGRACTVTPVCARRGQPPACG